MRRSNVKLRTVEDVEAAGAGRSLQSLMARFSRLEDASPVVHRQILLHAINPRDLSHPEEDSVSSRRGLGAGSALQELRASILQTGLLQPILVRSAAEAWICAGPECLTEIDSSDEPGACAECGAEMLPQYHLTDGQRRLEVHRMLNAEGYPGFTDISGIVHANSEEQARVASLVANLLSEPLTAIEQGQAIDRMLQVTGWSLAEAGGATGLSKGYLSRLRSGATKTTAKAQEILRDINAPIGLAWQTARVPKDDQVRYIRKVQSTAKSEPGGLTAAAETVREKFAEERETAVVEPPKPTSYTQRVQLEVGKNVVVRVQLAERVNEKARWRDVEAALERALDRGRRGDYADQLA